MQASLQARGAGQQAAGSRIRPLVSPNAPALGVIGRVGSRLAASPWALPAMKLMLLMCLVSGLSWVGSRATVLGWRVPGAVSSPERSAALAALPAPVAAAADAMVLPDAGTEGGAEAGAGAQPAAGVLPDGRVVLNAASEDELRKLPKVGAKRAAAIVALRQRMGRFRSARDLLRVKGIGLRTLQKMQPMMVLDAPPEGDAGR